jgi:riboflavin kinase/FMN adenylyltransferase
VPEVFAGSAAYVSVGSRPMLTMGNFDGLHHGHRHLISRLVACAHEQSVPACVYTFDPPPRVVLAPTRHQPRIQSWTDKVRIMGELGVDQVVVERFTRSFARHPPDWFVEEVLGRRIDPLGIVVGYDFRFGRARSGEVDTLRHARPKLPIEQVEPLEIGGDVVSSSRIRALVAEGEVNLAAQLLGCAHVVRGTVVAGEARGRTMGFPTANLETDAELLPARGVYACRARSDGSDWLPAVANLGTRPTFDGRGFLVEVHILDFSDDLYGAEMEVAFVDRLRGEQTFDGAESLRAQIQQDVLAARVVLEKAL